MNDKNKLSDTSTKTQETHSRLPSLQYPLFTLIIIAVLVIVMIVFTRDQNSSDFTLTRPTPTPSPTATPVPSPVSSAPETKTSSIHVTARPKVELFDTATADHPDEIHTYLRVYNYQGTKLVKDFGKADSGETFQVNGVTFFAISTIEGNQKVHSLYRLVETDDPDTTTVELILDNRSFPQFHFFGPDWYYHGLGTGFNPAFVAANFSGDKGLFIIMSDTDNLSTYKDDDQANYKIYGYTLDNKRLKLLGEFGNDLCSGEGRLLALDTQEGEIWTLSGKDQSEAGARCTPNKANSLVLLKVYSKLEVDSITQDAPIQEYNFPKEHIFYSVAQDKLYFFTKKAIYQLDNQYKAEMTLVYDAKQTYDENNEGFYETAGLDYEYLGRRAIIDPQSPAFYFTHSNDPDRECRVSLSDGEYYCIYTAGERAKPIIYLYPEQTTPVAVTLGKPNLLTTTYPLYDNGWHVTAQSDGTLTDQKGRTYYALYWEGLEDQPAHDLSSGFVVARDQLIDFLEEKLHVLGLNEREAEEFIVYWLPVLRQSEYNLIHFADQQTIETGMPLQVSPQPDSVIRVLMQYQPLDHWEDIDEQTLTTPARTGFTVVEWGGERLDSNTKH